MTEDDEQPPAQPEALRRQQRSLAVAGSILAGLAVVVGFLQRFPDLAPVGVLAGVVSGLVVYRLAAASVFPGEGSTTETTDDEQPASVMDDEQSHGLTAADEQSADDPPEGSTANDSGAEVCEET